MNKTTLYSRYGHSYSCAQINYGKNANELQKTTTDEETYRYNLVMYKHNQYARLLLAITDNSAQVAYKEVKENVYSGQETALVLSKTVQTSLGPPYSNCNQSTDYRQVTCFEECDKILRLENCGFGYDINFDKQKTPPGLLGKCKYFYFNDSGLDHIDSKCYQECPVECEQVSFQWKRVDVEFYINDLLDYFKRDISKKFNISKFSDDDIKKRLTKLDIYFDKFETTEITQSPSISLTSLIANVGGLLGK